MEGNKMKARSLPSSGQLLHSTVSLPAQRGNSNGRCLVLHRVSCKQQNRDDKIAYRRTCVQPSWRNLGSARSGSRKHLKNVNFFGQSYDSTKLLVRVERSFPRSLSARPRLGRGKRLIAVSGVSLVRALPAAAAAEILARSELLGNLSSRA